MYVLSQTDSAGKCTRSTPPGIMSFYPALPSGYHKLSSCISVRRRIINEKQLKVRLEKRFVSPTCAIETIYFIAELLALERTTYWSPHFSSRSHDKRSVSHNTEHTNKFIFCRISPFVVNYSCFVAEVFGSQM
jgi:hypothetical protein